ncbi:hypothetical protein GUJ93_ZPchr0010g10140 [Zizania palustris]|uniref:F-box domain-containing protein n=1 Tax=Zizania palustris TaxID=103762 RepID=A0A8J5WGS0_ZIZPA|nr:hypothetical protein GUJ93_ZPchr0010g10140 [Zizania palustris]
MAEQIVARVDGEQEKQERVQSADLQLTDLSADIMRCVLLRLPSEPVHLAAVTAVSKNMRGLVIDDNGEFLRAFRAANNGVPPPFLGFFANNAVRGPRCPFFTATAAGVVDLSPPPSAVERRPFVYDCRHGRVVLHGLEENQLQVWDPLTRRQDIISAPMAYFTSEAYGASIICGCDAGAGLEDCHSAPYHVVVAFSDQPPYWRRDALSDENVYASVWSSETREWSDLYTMKGNISFDYMPSAIVADAVHWLVGDSSEVLQFHLKTHQLQLIETPLDIGDGEFTLFPTKLDTLGYAGVLGEHIVIFHRDVAGDAATADVQWNILNVLHLDNNYFPITPVTNVTTSAVPLPMDNVALSDSDDFDEDIVYGDQNYGFVPSSNLKVIGFVEEANAVLLRVVGMGVFMIHIETSCRQKVADYQNYHIVYPYSSFYTGGKKPCYHFQ